jgi:DNA-binding NarL/FixJ family response regulator
MKTGDSSVRRAVLLRVLVADSGVSINDSLTALLSSFEGLSVFGCVQAPDKVLALVKAVHPEVVILDLLTEGSASLLTLRRIKGLPTPPVVIVLAHFDLPPLRDAAIAAGADHFLLKATECGRLQELLRGLRWKRAAVAPPLARNHGSVAPVSFA